MSVDGGATWRQLPTPPGGLAFRDSVHWWSLGSRGPQAPYNAVFTSADAGQTWKQVATISPNLQFTFLGVLDSTHAWASLFVMDGYGLAFTSDGGRHWTQAKVPQPA